MASTPPVPEHDPVPIEVPVDRVAAVLAVTHKPCENTDIRKKWTEPADEAGAVRGCGEVVGTDSWCNDGGIYFPTR